MNPARLVGAAIVGNILLGHLRTQSSAAWSRVRTECATSAYAISPSSPMTEGRRRRVAHRLAVVLRQRLKLLDDSRSRIDCSGQGPGGLGSHEGWGSASCAARTFTGSLGGDGTRNAAPSEVPPVAQAVDRNALHRSSLTVRRTYFPCRQRRATWSTSIVVAARASSRSQPDP